MHRAIIIAVIILLLGAAGGVVGFFVSQNAQSNQPVTYGSVQKDVRDGAQFFDVRTPNEYLSGHFENAINWPVENIEKGSLPNVKKKTKIYVYCQSGNRSKKAAEMLKEAGYTDVIDLGGVTDVQSLGGTLVQ